METTEDRPYEYNIFKLSSLLALATGFILASVWSMSVAEVLGPDFVEQNFQTDFPVDPSMYGEDGFSEYENDEDMLETFSNYNISDWNEESLEKSFENNEALVDEKSGGLEVGSDSDEQNAWAGSGSGYQEEPMPQMFFSSDPLMDEVNPYMSTGSEDGNVLNFFDGQADEETISTARDELLEFQSRVTASDFEGKEDILRYVEFLQETMFSESVYNEKLPHEVRARHRVEFEGLEEYQTSRTFNDPYRDSNLNTPEQLDDYFELE